MPTKPSPEQDGTLTHQLSRRDVLKAAGFAGLGALLAACAPNWTRLGEGEVTPGVEDGLIYMSNPFFDADHIQSAIGLGIITETRVGLRGANGERTLRVLECDDWGGDFFPRVDITNAEARAKLKDIKRVMKKEVSKLVMLQSWDESIREWVPVPLPATMETVRIFEEAEQALSRLYPPSLNNDQMAVRAKLNSAMHPAMTDGTQAVVIINELFPNESDRLEWAERILRIRQGSFAIPEDTSVDVIAAIQQAEFFPHTQENYEVLSDFASNAGLLKHAIFVPKNVPEKFTQRIEAWKETFIEIEPEPEVWMVTRQSFLRGGNETHIFVKHKDENGNPDVGNSLLDHNGAYGTVSAEAMNEFAGRGVLTGLDLNGPEAQELFAYFRNADSSLTYSDPISISKVNPGMLDIFMVPNKLLGQNRARVAHGLQFKYYYEDDVDKSHPTEAALLFSDMARDDFWSFRMIEQPFNNWLTNRTAQIKELMALGVQKVDKWGGRSPLRSMAWLMQGYNDSLHSYDAIIPRSPYLQGVLLGMYYEILATDRYNKQTNLGVVMEDGVAVQYLEAKDVATWVEAIGDRVEKVFKLEDPIAPLSSTYNVAMATEVDGSPVLLNQGAVLPIGNPFQSPDGKWWLPIGTTQRDQDGYGIDKEKMLEGFRRFGNWLKDGLLVDDITGVLVIPYDEARLKVMPLDPDPNLWEAIKVAAISAAIVFLVLAPQSAVAAVTTLPGILVKGGLKSLWNWMGVAGREAVAVGARALMR